MAISLVQKKGAQSASATAGLSVTLDAPPTPGNLVVACCNSDATVATPAGFALAVSAVAAQGLYVFCRVAQAGDSATVTFAPSVADSVAAAVLEYSGLTASPLDQVASNTTVSTSASIATGTTGATSQANELAIAVAGPHSAGAPWTLQSWAGGFVDQVDEGNGIGLDFAGCFVADLILSAIGTQATTATFTGTFSSAGAAIATFKGAAIQSLAADGLAASAGSAGFTVSGMLAADGRATSSGSAVLTFAIGLMATGLASSSGSALLATGITLRADGRASSSGSAVFPGVVRVAPNQIVVVDPGSTQVIAGSSGPNQVVIG